MRVLELLLSVGAVLRKLKLDLFRHSKPILQVAFFACQVLRSAHRYDLCRLPQHATEDDAFIGRAQSFGFSFPWLR